MRLGAWILFGALAAVCLGALAVFERRSTQQTPDVDLKSVDPVVARLIEDQIATVKASPGDPSAHGNLGYALRNYSFSREALRCFREAERLDPRNPRWPYFQSWLLAVESPAEALVKARRAAELSENEPEAPRFRLATLLAESGDWRNAEREAQDLFRAKPGFTPALLLQARCALARSNFTEAITLARRSVDDPRTARAATLLLANLHSRTGDSETGGTLLAKAAKLPPDELVADPFLAAAALFRRDPHGLAEQAHPLLASGNLREAEAIIARLKAEHPNFAETWLLLGRLQYLKKDLPGALASLEQHLQLDPKSAQGWFQIGLCQMVVTNFGAARASFKTATELKSDFGAAYYNEGLALFRSGQIRDSIGLFEEAARLNPERIDPYLMLIEAWLRSGDRSRAVELFRRAETLNREHPALPRFRSRVR